MFSTLFSLFSCFPYVVISSLGNISSRVHKIMDDMEFCNSSIFLSMEFCNYSIISSILFSIYSLFASIFFYIYCICICVFTNSLLVINLPLNLLVLQFG
jgi:hypothetical protein